MRAAALLDSGVLVPGSTTPSRRDRAVDAAGCVLAAVLGALFISPTLRSGDGLATAQLAVDVTCGVLAVVSLWWRRRWPVGVALCCLLLGTLSISATPAGLLAQFSLAVHGPARRALLVAGLWVPSVLLFAFYSPTTDPLAVLVRVVPIVLAVTAWGMFIRARRQLLHSLRDRAQRAEADQRQHEDRARMAERTRIAREMHDVLGHRISLLALHAGALEVRPDLPSAEVRATAELMRLTARQALEELRTVIGVLREVSGEAEVTPPVPQPTLADIPRLVDDTRQAGAQISLDMRVDAGRRRSRCTRPRHVPDRAGGTDQHRQTRQRLGGAVGVTGAPGHGLHINVRNTHPSRPVRADPARVRRRSSRPPRTRRPRRRHPRARSRRIGQLRGAGRPAMVTVRVLLVDDDALVRAGLRIILSSAEDIEVVGETDDGTRAVAAVRQHRPDVVLMDIRMAEMDGITATAALRRLDRPPHVIVLTTFQADDMVMNALEPVPADSWSKTPHPPRSSTPSASSPPATRSSHHRSPAPCCPTSATPKCPNDGKRRPTDLPPSPTANVRSPPQLRPGLQRRSGHRAVPERGNRESPRVTASQQARRRQPRTDRDLGPRRQPVLT